MLDNNNLLRSHEESRITAAQRGTKKHHQESPNNVNDTGKRQE